MRQAASSFHQHDQWHHAQVCIHLIVHRHQPALPLALALRLPLPQQRHKASRHARKRVVAYRQLLLLLGLLHQLRAHICDRYGKRAGAQQQYRCGRGGTEGGVGEELWKEMRERRCGRGAGVEVRKEVREMRYGGGDMERRRETPEEAKI